MLGAGAEHETTPPGDPDTGAEPGAEPGADRRGTGNERMTEVGRPSQSANMGLLAWMWSPSLAKPVEGTEEQTNHTMV